MTILRGKVAWDGHDLHVTPGTGQFVPLPLFDHDRPENLGAALSQPPEYVPPKVSKALMEVHAEL